MRSHILHVHERVRGHICDICAKAFITKQALEGHRLTHTDTEQTRIPCNICGALLKNAFSLERHLKRHTDGPQTCKYCNKVKPNRSALASHMLNVHSKPIHQCTLCDKSFKKTLSLTVHFSQVFAKKYFFKWVYLIYFFVFILFHFALSRSIWLHIQVKIYTHVLTVHKCFVLIRTCTNIESNHTPSNGHKTEARNYQKIGSFWLFSYFYWIRIIP